MTSHSRHKQVPDSTLNAWQQSHRKILTYCLCLLNNLNIVSHSNLPNSFFSFQRFLYALSFTGEISMLLNIFFESMCDIEREREREYKKQRERDTRRDGRIIREIVSPVWARRLCVLLWRRSSMGRTHKWIHSAHYRARRDGMKFVRVCACASARPEAKATGAVFSHLTRLPSKCHKWAEIGTRSWRFINQS